MPRTIPALACIDLYLSIREAEGVSPNTLTIYRYALTDFASVGLPEDVKELSELQAAKWITAMRNRGMSDGGIATYQRSVWTWFRWLHEQGYVDVDLSRRVKRVRPKEVVRRTAREDVKGKLLRVLEKRYGEHRYRNTAIVEVLFDTGVRREELCNLRLEDIDLRAGELYVRKAKGGRPRLVGIGASARAALLAYLAHERGREEGWLFLARGERQMTGNAVKQVMDHLGKLANVKVSAHDFRRGCASRLLAQGAPVDVVMSQLGHSSMSMTLLYGDSARTERSIAEFHRLDRERRRA